VRGRAYFVFFFGFLVSLRIPLPFAMTITPLRVLAKVSHMT
jgi:hypothetical protein